MSYLVLDSLAIVHGHAHSVQNDSILSEVNIIQDPPTPPSATKLLSNDPDESVASLNLTNKSTIKKIDNIIEEINEPDTSNNKQNEREDGILVMTGNGTMDWIYHSDLNHVLQPHCKSWMSFRILVLAFK